MTQPLRYTEFKPAGEIREGDELTMNRGTVTKVLNDSGVITFETTTKTFMKHMYAPVERYQRSPDKVYGLEWCRLQGEIAAGLADGLDL